MLLAVNYHYVGPDPGYPYPAIFPTPPEQLQRQLDALGGKHSLMQAGAVGFALAGLGPSRSRYFDEVPG